MAKKAIVNIEDSVLAQADYNEMISEGLPLFENYFEQNAARYYDLGTSDLFPYYNQVGDSLKQAADVVRKVRDENLTAVDLKHGLKNVVTEATSRYKKENNSQTREQIKHANAQVRTIVNGAKMNYYMN